MSNVQWKRRGDRFEHNVLIVSGYRLNEQNEFIKCDQAVTMINPLDFNHFVGMEDTVEKIDGTVKFSFGDVVYYSDIPLVNAIISVACDILWDAADVAMNDEGDLDEDVTVLNL
jgi:hypothetical protein